MKIPPKLTFIGFMAILGFVIVMNPPLGIILVVSIIIHELGHVVVAKHYKLFKGFILTNGGVGITHYRPDTYKKTVHIAMSGFLFSLIPAIIGGVIFLDLGDLFTIILSVVVASSYDFINIIKLRNYYKTEGVNEQAKEKGES